jgi:hypothetical protein
MIAKAATVRKLSFDITPSSSAPRIKKRHNRMIAHHNARPTLWFQRHPYRGARGHGRQISTRNPTSMMASWGILKKSGARLAIRLRKEKTAKDIGSMDDPVSRRTIVSWAM